MRCIDTTYLPRIFNDESAFKDKRERPTVSITTLTPFWSSNQELIFNYGVNKIRSSGNELLEMKGFETKNKRKRGEKHGSIKCESTISTNPEYLLIQSSKSGSSTTMPAKSLPRVN
ncbi:7387_t:CDS:2, partial [Dentiscutata erythropus]